MKSLDTDVLIIGGGLAGLSAALSAGKRGIRTTIICKAAAGSSGNTIVSGAGISVWMPDNGQGDSRTLFEKDLLRSGADINDRLMIRRVLEQSEFVLPFLETNGVKLRYLNGNPMVKKPGGHSAARYYSADFRRLAFQTRGLSLTLPLRTAARNAGTEFLDRTTALKLTKSDGRVTGCLCLDQKTGEMFHVTAGSIILAAGGGASVYEKTNNVRDVSCDSFRLGLEAGVRLRDMEFIQFYPCVMFQPVRLQIGSALFGEGAILRNADGEDFMHRYSEAGNLATRDAMSIAIQSEINRGKGDPNHVFVDCSGIAGDILDGKFKELSDALHGVGIDIGKDLIPVEPAAHFYLGGICVDDEQRTDAEGLYACGEATGGLHGANRLPGAALMEAVVSGLTAGESAADHFSQRPCLGDRWIDLPAVNATTEIIDWKQKIRDLRVMVWKNASVIRSGDSLIQLEQYLESQKEYLPLTEVVSRDMRSAYEYRSFYLTAQMLLRSAQARKESRGAHYRSDYPEKNEAFTGNFLCRLGQTGEVEINFEASSK